MFLFPDQDSDNPHFSVYNVRLAFTFRIHGFHLLYNVHGYSLNNIAKQHLELRLRTLRYC